MNLGCSTNAYTEKSLIYAIKSIAAIGYDGIEIVLDIPHAYLPIKKSNLEIIKNEIKSIDITQIAPSISKFFGISNDFPSATIF